MNILNKTNFKCFLKTLEDTYKKDIANIEVNLKSNKISLFKESTDFKQEIINHYNLEYRTYVSIKQKENEFIEVTNLEKEELDKALKVYMKSPTEPSKKKIYEILQPLFEKHQITQVEFLDMNMLLLDLRYRIKVDITLVEDEVSNSVLNDLHEQQFLDTEIKGVTNETVIEIDDFLMSKLKVPVANPEKDVPKQAPPKMSEKEEIWDKSLNRNITSIEEMVTLQKSVPIQEPPNYKKLDAMLLAIKEDLDMSKLNMQKIEMHLRKVIENEIPFSELFIEGISKNILKRLQNWLYVNHMLIRKYKVYCRTEFCYGYATKGYTYDKQLKLNYLLNYCNQFENFESIVWETNTIKKEEVLQIYNELFSRGCLDCEQKIELKELINLYKKYNGDLFTIAYYEYVEVEV